MLLIDPSLRLSAKDNYNTAIISLILYTNPKSGIPNITIKEELESRELHFNPETKENAEMREGAKSLIQLSGYRKSIRDVEAKVQELYKRISISVECLPSLRTGYKYQYKTFKPLEIDSPEESIKERIFTLIINPRFCKGQG
jgi:hypothetical protein